MKLNDIDFNKLSQKEIISICLKYKLIDFDDIKKYSRKDLLKILHIWLHKNLKIMVIKRNTFCKICIC